MSKQNWYSLGAVVLVVILAGWLSQNNKPKNTENTSEQNVVQNSEPNPPKTVPEKKQWQGVLKNSDNAKKGNFVLVTKDRVIYIKTSREFSSLVNKNVIVTYEGDLNSFKLGDIFLPNTNNSQE